MDWELNTYCNIFQGTSVLRCQKLLIFKLLFSQTLCPNCNFPSIYSSKSLSPHSLLPPTHYSSISLLTKISIPKDIHQTWPNKTQKIGHKPSYHCWMGHPSRRKRVPSALKRFRDTASLNQLGVPQEHNDSIILQLSTLNSKAFLKIIYFICVYGWVKGTSGSAQNILRHQILSTKETCCPGRTSAC